MKPTTSLRTIGALALAGFTLTAGFASGQSLDFVSRTQITENNQRAKISVFPGKAGYESTNVSPTNSGTFGDGTVTDYAFYSSDGNNIFRYGDGGAGLIDSTATGPEFVSGTQNWSSLWDVTDPGSPLYSTTPDIDPAGWSGGADVTGTIDISSLSGAGSLYFMHGTFNNGWTLTVTMKDDDLTLPDIVASDTNGGIGNNNRGYISEFQFCDAAGYETIEYYWFHQDRDGSRARFMGVIIDEDTTGPVITPVNPPDDFTEFFNQDNLEFSLNENYAIDDTTANITILDLDNTTSTVISISDTTQVSFVDDRVIIDPAVDLLFETNYAVQIDAAIFADCAVPPNVSAGISDTTTWNFTTLAQDLTAPVVNLLSPADDSGEVSVRTNLVVTFDERIKAGTGNIILRNLSGSIDTTIDVLDASQVTIDGSVLTIDPTDILAGDANYAIQIESGAIQNLSGLAFAGITNDTDWNFATQLRPTPVAYWPMRDGLPGESATTADDVIDDPSHPAADASGASASDTWEADCERGIVWSTGEGSRLRAGEQGIDLNVHEGWTWAFWVKAASSNNTDPGADSLMGSRSGTWNKLDRTGASNWINPSYPNWADDTWRHIAFIGDASGAQVYYDGVAVGSKDTTFNGGPLRTDIADDPLEIGGTSRFSEDVTGLYSDVVVYDVALTPAELQAIVNGVSIIDDTTAALLIATTPVDDDPAAPLGDLQAIFSEPIQAGSGDIRIVNDSDVVTTTISIDDTTQVLVAGACVTISPDVALIGGKDYHVELDAGAVEDLSGNAFPGIIDTTTWNFTADGTAPTVAMFEDDKSGGLVYDNDSVVYSVTFSEAMNASTIEVGDFSNSASGTASITVDSVSATGDPAVYEVVVTPTSTGTIQLQVSAGANLEDLSGNALDTSSPVPDDSVITVIPFAPNAASIVNDFQGTIASEQHPTYAGEARYYHVSVNPANPGTGSYAATIVGTNDPAPPFVRNYTAPVVGYKFAGGANNNINAVAQSGGEASRISFSTPDTSFDGFGQSQAKIWTTTDPGADIQTTIPDPYNAVDDVGSTGGWRSLGGAIGTVDISGLESGSVHIYYGAFSATPSVSVVMRDTSGLAPDVTIADAHSIADGGNGDAANRTEYYLAEIDFVTDGLYDVIEFTWSADGDGDLTTGNGRGIATVLTGPEPSGDDYTVWAEMFPGADLSDPNGDFDGDGLTNNEERLFGTDPTDPSSLNQYPTGLFDSTEFTFSFSRRDDALTGLFSDIETSFDLQMWTEDIGAMLVEGAVDGSTMVEIVEVTLSPGLLTAPKLFVRVNQNEGVFISENFEVDNGGFTVVTTAGTDWEHGAPDSSGLGGAVSGGNGGSTNAWGTNLGDFSGTTGNPGYYADSTITSLRSTVIDLTGVSAAELLFAEALDLEAGDTAVVNIIDDTTDTVISSAIYTASDGDDASADWNNVGPIAIPAGALGQAVRIEWLFTGFGGATDDYLGWYIDDVTVRRAAP